MYNFSNRDKTLIGLVCYLTDEETEVVGLAQKHTVRTKDLGTTQEKQSPLPLGFIMNPRDGGQET